MKKRIIAEYSETKCFNGVYHTATKMVPVKSIEDGRKLIAKKGPDGEGVITEQYEDMYFIWCNEAAHYVSGGFIYRTENY